MGDLFLCFGIDRGKVQSVSWWDLESGWSSRVQKNEFLDLVENWPRSETNSVTKMTIGRAGLSYLLPTLLQEGRLSLRGKEKVLPKCYTWGSWWVYFSWTFFLNKTDNPTIKSPNPTSKLNSNLWSNYVFVNSSDTFAKFCNAYLQCKRP